MTVRRRVRMLVTGANDAHTSRDGLSHKRFTTSSYYSKDAARRTFRPKKRCRTCPGSFLLLSARQPCTERLRAESERILRFQPFLADATVRAFPDDVGGVRIEVESIDEILDDLHLAVMKRRAASPPSLCCSRTS